MSKFPPGTRPEDTRSIDVEVEIDASVEDVWPYLSTSDGLSSWYVGAEFEAEAANVGCKLTFGPGMVIPAHVLAYERQDRVRLGPPPGVDSPRVEEYSVRPKDGGGCIVRVVNWGFGEGAEWDDEYNSVKKGWGIFLRGLKLTVENFLSFGRPATIQLVSMSADADGAWSKIKEALGAGAVDSASHGKPCTVGASLGEPFSGTVFVAAERELGLVDTSPDGGVIFHAIIENPGAMAMVGVTFRFFGDRRGRFEEAESTWGSWFGEAFPPPQAPA